MANYQSSYVGNQIDAAVSKANVVTVPTKVSDLANDSHFITSAVIPTKTSDLYNDNSFITSAIITSITTNLITTAIFDLIYPIGSYYWSSNFTNPEFLFGGTWEPVENRFIFAAGSGYAVNSTGGTATVSCTPNGTVGNTTLTTAQIPAHQHNIPSLQGHGRYVWSTASPTGSAWSYVVKKVTSVGDWASADNKLKTVSGNTNNSGGGEGHNHTWSGVTTTFNSMPPYIVAYCWHRTA